MSQSSARDEDLKVLKAPGSRGITSDDTADIPSAAGGSDLPLVTFLETLDFDGLDLIRDIEVARDAAL